MKKILKILGIVLGSIVAAAAIFILVLSIIEYKPAQTEVLTVAGQSSAMPSAGSEYTAVTWNIGYGALGESADFFMDGGKGVKTADADGVKENVNAVISFLENQNADLMFLQEIDRSSDRSSKINEAEMTVQAFPEMESVFANNFKVAFVPYPIPPIGKVDSGLLSLSSVHIEESVREALPCPFKWPVRLANLKRCLQINRIPREGSEHELVAVNLHLEAYDSGEGKIAQTKMLCSLLQSEMDKGNYVIAAGDFNQVFDTVDYSMYPVLENRWQPGLLDTSQFEEGWQFVTDNTCPTCRSLDQPYKGADQENFQYYLIDGFIVSENVEVLSCKTQDLGFVNSDHNPLVLSFRLK